MFVINMVMLITFTIYYIFLLGSRRLGTPDNCQLFLINHMLSITRITYFEILI